MSGSDQHIPLSMHMSALVLKTLTRFAFGEYFNSDEAIVKFKEDYDMVSFGIVFLKTVSWQNIVTDIIFKFHLFASLDYL